jgi:hypothetical protein
VTNSWKAMTGSGARIELQHDARKGWMVISQAWMDL